MLCFSVFFLTIAGMKLKRDENSWNESCTNFFPPSCFQRFSTVVCIILMVFGNLVFNVRRAEKWDELYLWSKLYDQKLRVKTYLFSGGIEAVLGIPLISVCLLLPFNHATSPVSRYDIKRTLPRSGDWTSHHLRRLTTVSSNFKLLTLMGQYYKSLSVAATIMISSKCPIIAE